ncbi:MAG TPA: serine/threonine-protein kinase [Thermoguttaceae bacterium]|nr:serine/threonine-protein kinase [Thermoguttaceae bacterium]
MRDHARNPTFASITDLETGKEVLLAERIASEIKDRWRRGEPPDTAVALSDHSQLKRHRSIVLDLACDEYFHRVRRGESLDADEFSRRFPSMQKSLLLLIEVNRLLDEHPDFRESQGGIAWPKPGTRFLGFSLICELGRGTFARVFLASEPALGNRYVALKVSPHGGPEAEVLGKLRHPNVVPVYSVREDKATGLTAVCMPYLGRATLADILDFAFAGPSPPSRAQVILDTVQSVNQSPVSPESVLVGRVFRRGSYVNAVIHLGVQLAEALAYAHSRGVCHRDLKPSNVLVSLGARPLLLDFNLSSDGEVEICRIGGTLPYMAPEQLRSTVLEQPDRQLRADPRTDVFSLGVILYELLSGSLPFAVKRWNRPAEDIANDLLEEQKRGARPLRERNERADGRLALVVDECLAFDPGHRPQSASALAVALRRQLTPLRIAKRWVRDHRIRAFALGASFMLLILLVSGHLIFRDPYSVRQYEVGLEHYAQGQYQSAAEDFCEAIQSDPRLDEARFARARTYLRLREFRLALEDFDELLSRTPTAEVKACMGYCLSALEYHKEAIDCYGDAMEMGSVSPELLNNMGFSYSRLNRLAEAEQWLQKALALDPELQAAHHNLVLVFLTKGTSSGEPVSGSALGHAEKAIEIGPTTAGLYRDAAALYALAERASSLPPEPVLTYLEKAVSHGLDPRPLRTDPLFHRFCGHERFDALIEAPLSENPPIAPDHLLDPLGQGVIGF